MTISRSIHKTKTPESSSSGDESLKYRQVTLKKHPKETNYWYIQTGLPLTSWSDGFFKYLQWRNLKYLQLGFFVNLTNPIDMIFNDLVFEQNISFL